MSIANKKQDSMSPNQQDPERTQAGQEENDLDIFSFEENIRYPRLNAFLDNTYLNILVACVVFFALFGDDINIVLFDNTADIYFDVITIIVIIIFTVEISLTLLARPDYNNSFFFWLDVISTASLLMDLSWMKQGIHDFSENANISRSYVARIQRATKLGARAGRIVRLVRLMKIFNNIGDKKSNDNQQQKKVKRDKLQSLHGPKVAPQGDNKPGSFAEIPSYQDLNINGPQNIPLDKFRKSHYSSNFKSSFHNQQQNNENKNHVENSLGSNNNIQASKFNKKMSIEPSAMKSKHSRNENNNKQTSPNNSKNQIVQQSINVNQSSQQQIPEKKDPPAPKEKKESRVSKRLQDKIMKRVVILILALLIFMPLFQYEFWIIVDSSVILNVKNLKDLALNNKITEADMNNALKYLVEAHEPTSEKSLPILKVEVDIPIWNLTNQINEKSEIGLLRVDEKLYVNSSIDVEEFISNRKITDAQYLKTLRASGSSMSIHIIASQRFEQKMSALLGLFKTIYICLVLLVGALAFSYDANKHALAPIERMITKVNEIARNPISAKKQSIEKEDVDQKELITIENAIIKIGTLLALGFGAAGSEIIGSNMVKAGDIDPMIKGKKKCAIYGFCDIRNFTDTTECLEEQVMMFVNNIGSMVHNVIDRFQGTANKNIGDAFLLVWKIDEDKVSINKDNSLAIHDGFFIQRMVDFALLSFIKVQAKIFREPILLEYRNEAKLNNRMPNYKVKMGYGLHLGWGIEGAIGSLFKIDASYLSQNVNMSNKLEELTKTYGLPMLLSSQFHEQLSNEMKEFTRTIDKVRLSTGFQMDVIGIDMEYENLPPSKPINAKNLPPKEYEQFLEQKKDELYEKVFLDDQWKMNEYVLANKDIRMLVWSQVQRPADEDDNIDFYEKKNDIIEFYQNKDEIFQTHQQLKALFQPVYEAYIGGKWEDCEKLCEKVQEFRPNDGPTMHILNLIQSKDHSQDNWPGYNEI